MEAVAITHLHGTVEYEAEALAKDLGTTAYEERMRLLRGLPAIVLRSADPLRVDTLVSALRERGHTAVSCDVAKVVKLNAMLPMRQFRLTEKCIVLTERGDILPYPDILGFVRAHEHAQEASVVETTTKKFSPGRAILSGGLVMKKAVTTETKTFTDKSQQLLVVFPPKGATPWLLREREANYGWLGSDLKPSSNQNFSTTVALLRKYAPDAFYNEQLAGPRANAQELDLLAHIIAVASDGASA